MAGEGVIRVIDLGAGRYLCVGTVENFPNFAIPEMNGVAQWRSSCRYPQGVCDFISTMDTPRIAEWNMWYHLLNCGFPLKVSGETDFPCMSGLRVGQGRVYVRLGKVRPVGGPERPGDLAVDDDLDPLQWHGALRRAGQSVLAPAASVCSKRCPGSWPSRVTKSIGPVVTKLRPASRPLSQAAASRPPSSRT